MKNIPKINSIASASTTLIDPEQHRRVAYQINQNRENLITTVLPYFGRPEISTEIVASSKHFVNGFKVVQTSNGEFAYIRQSDSQLLPFRYDVASDFNEYGFAMVGKDASVSWIDTTFRYLNQNGEMTEETLDDEYSKFNGWQEISNFSRGTTPLSQVYDVRTSRGIVAYFGVNGKLKDFYQYNGKMDAKFPKRTFNNGTVFDEFGHAMADGTLLFAKGYYITYEDLIKICNQKGFIGAIEDDAEVYLDEETGEVLKEPRYTRVIHLDSKY